MLRALDRELRLVREAGEQRKLTVVELAAADRGGQRGNAVALELERRDDDARDTHLCGDRHRLDVRRLEDERIGALEPGVRELAREPPAARRVVLTREAERRARDQVARLRLLLDPERGAARPEHTGSHLGAAPEHFFRRLGGGELAARVEQRVRDLCRFELLPVEARLLQRDRRLVGERREQTVAILVERLEVEHDPAAHAVTLRERCVDTELERLADVSGAGVVDPERRALGLEERARRRGGQPADLVERRRLGELIREGEQRLRTLGLTALLLVEARVLECHRSLAGEHLEQAHVVLVELVGAELRDHDRAGDARAVAQRHGRKRLLELVGAGNALRELALERVRHEQRLARCDRAAGDALADLERVRVGGGADVRIVVADERDRQQVVAVAQDDTAVVVVDQQPELGRDRVADLAHVVQPVELARERLQHLQVRDRAHVARRRDRGRRRPLGGRRRRRARSGSCRAPSRSSSPPRRRR